MKINKYVIADILFWGFVCPFLIYQSYIINQNIIYIIISTIIITHLVVLYIRYYVGTSLILLPHYMEVICVLMSLILLGKSIQYKLIFLAIGSIWMFIAHFRRMLDPSIDYYYF